MTFWIVVEWFWIVIEMLFKNTNKPNFYKFKNIFKTVAFIFWIVVDFVFEMWLNAFQKHKQSEPLVFQKKQNSWQLFFIKPRLKHAKQVHKGYPLCHYKLKWTFAIKNNLFGSPAFVFSLWLNGFELWLNAFEKHKQSEPLQIKKN